MLFRVTQLCGIKIDSDDLRALGPVTPAPPQDAFDEGAVTTARVKQPRISLRPPILEESLHHLVNRSWWCLYKTLHCTLIYEFCGDRGAFKEYQS
ncbi:MAG: hypothetical protein ACREXP_06785 [Steroidobacteraceae bacterium]